MSLKLLILLCFLLKDGIIKCTANGNKVVDQWVARSWQGIQSIIAASTSVGGALQGSFAELQSNNWFDKSATFVGAFRDASDDWTAGWANFDPENTIY